MKTSITKTSQTNRRHRIRAKIKGTADRPRLAVHKSLKHLHVQLIDDTKGKTLASLSSLSLKIRGSIAAATKLGQAVAVQAIALGIKEVVFDRGGYPYHGQVKAVAEAARAEGLKF
ncbi:MAG: 50S ribosomal protein L18 [Patescibacteria group bacterium]|jgi:large subunit ribosomal protein L18